MSQRPYVGCVPPDEKYEIGVVVGGPAVPAVVMGLELARELVIEVDDWHDLGALCGVWDGLQELRAVGYVGRCA